jgi:ribosomal protein L16 Arg81 hydroxylase
MEFQTRERMSSNGADARANVLPHILGEVSPADFFATYYGTTPLLRRASAKWVTSLATDESCERLAASDQVDFLAVRDGQPSSGGRPSLEQARELLQAGYTWVMRDADRGDARLAEFGRVLASEVHGALHLHVYRTPRAHVGFGWHFDPEEVFFFQTSGRKMLRLRENTAHPKPLLERMPTHLKAASEDAPIVEYLLEPGDWLYIPSGFWHSAEAVEESISISAGILAPSYLDALAAVAHELAQDAQWRQRLFPIGRGNPLPEDERHRAWQEQLGRLAAEVSRRLTSPASVAKIFAVTGWWKRR